MFKKYLYTFEEDKPVVTEYNWRDYFKFEDEESEASTLPIDKVTLERLSAACRTVGINLQDETLDNIIDLVELIEEKGGDVSIDDLENLQEKWSQ